MVRALVLRPQLLSTRNQIAYTCRASISRQRPTSLNQHLSLHTTASQAEKYDTRSPGSGLNGGSQQEPLPTYFSGPNAQFPNAQQGQTASQQASFNPTAGQYYQSGTDQTHSRRSWTGRVLRGIVYICGVTALGLWSFSTGVERGFLLARTPDGIAAADWKAAAINIGRSKKDPKSPYISLSPRAGEHEDLNAPSSQSVALLRASPEQRKMLIQKAVNDAHEELEKLKHARLEEEELKIIALCLEAAGFALDNVSE